MISDIIILFLKILIGILFSCRLYSSPKPPSAKQRTLSPYKWVRQDFEHGGSDLDAARKSLVFKLEDVRKCKYHQVFKEAMTFSSS